MATEGQSETEIANKLNISRSTVYGHLAKNNFSYRTMCSKTKETAFRCIKSRT